MERRYAQANGTAGHHASTHNLRPTNSFIPTSASVHGHGHHPPVNIPHGNVASKIHMHQNISNSNIQQLPNSQSHSQQQQQSHSQLPNSHSQLPQQSHHHGNNYYHQNSSGTNHTGGHHQQPLHSQQQNLQHQQLQYQRAVSTKSYSSTHYNNGTNPPSAISSNNIHHQQQQQQHHFYGSTTSNHQSVHTMNGHGQQQQHLPSSAVHQIPPQQYPPQQQQQQHQYPSNNNAITTAYHNHYQPAETEGLPQTLVDSMRTLFDILDDTKQGKIRLSDIESRWETDPNGTNGKTTGAEPLIKMGVMGYLRKVTPPDGLLTFERFCAGLRLALLTNNNNASAQNQNPPNPNSQQFPQPPPPQQIQQYPQQPPSQHPQQQTFHPQQQPMQVKTLTTNVSHSINNSVHPNNNNYSQSNSNTLPASSSTNKQMMLSLQNNQPATSNTMHRTSKIPSLSSSRLPMPNNGASGIPVSPNNRISATYSSTNGNGPSPGNPTPNGTTTMNTSNISSTSIGSGTTNNANTMKRQPTTPEQGTTVAIVHHQPKALGIPSYSGSSTLKINKQSSTTVLSTNNKYNTKNGSLDNLKSPSEEKTMMGTSAKERPPSAPLLDNESDVDERPKEYSSKINHNTVRNNHGQSQIHSNNAARRERARSRDREREDLRKSPDDIDRDGNKRIHYVSPRQRTLSMPQLQLSKLKPKSIINIEDSPSPPSATTSTETKKAQSSTTNGLKSNKSLPLIAPSFVSAIPTVGMTSKQKNDTSPAASGSSNPGTIEREKERDKEQPPPPPKPPRNTLNGPVIVTTNMVSNEIIVTEVPKSGGSSSTISGNGSNPSKPEIRSALQTWQKGLSEKKPLESTLSSASTVNSMSAISVISNSNSTSTSSAVPTVNKSETTNNNTTENDVKTRSNNKTNLRRRETPRRHTVQSGIDFATLKRLKQLEQERDVLQQGITYLEKAKEWYQKQLEGADEKIGLLSKGAPASEYWSESHEERLNLLGCRVSEVNSLLTALMDGSSLPLHMNLQIPTHLSLRTITRLKEQNRQLTQEVSECGHRVTQLEAEKAMLLRQLFHQKNNHHSEETVYM